MPQFEHGESSIYYEEHGSGSPLLLIAPGAMNSTVEWWGRAAFNPIDTYAGDFRIVAMDQRHAGRSTGPFDLEDPWGSFVGDQLALMDHLGHRSFHVLGCCIGCSYALGLIERAPERIASAVLEQPIGINEGNRAAFAGMWREWAGQVTARRQDVGRSTVEAFGTRMWEGEFVLSVSRDFVRTIETPLLVLPGIDDFHPGPVAHEIAELARNAEVLEPWKDTPELIQRAVEHVREFLRTHTSRAATVG